MDLVEDYYVDQIHDKRCCKEDPTERRADNKRDREDKGCEEIEQRFVYLLEDKKLGAKFPPVISNVRSCQRSLR